MLTIDELRELQGRTMLGSGGDSLGTVDDLYVSRTDAHPTFATVVDERGGVAFVPLAEAVLRDGDLVVPYDPVLVDSAPWLSDDPELSPSEEDQLYAHYGLPPVSPRNGEVEETTQPRQPILRRYVVDAPVTRSPAAPPQKAAQQAVGETAATAKDEVAQTAQTTRAAAGDVADTAKEQVGVVAGEAVSQVRQLADQAREQAAQQADTATQRLSSTVRSLAGEMRDLSEGQADGSGTMAGLAQLAADRADDLATYLARQGPAGMLEEVRSFAKRRPGTFLLGALAAGALTGRAVKGAAAGSAADAEAGRPMREPAVDRLPSPTVDPVPVVTAPPPTSPPLADPYLEDPALEDSLAEPYPPAPLLDEAPGHAVSPRRASR